SAAPTVDFPCSLLAYVSLSDVLGNCRARARLGVSEAAATCLEHAHALPRGELVAALRIHRLAIDRMHPAYPVPPPNMPRPRNRVRLPMPSVTSGCWVSLRTMTSWPRPPRQRPGPAESGISRLLSIVVWVNVSHTSTGTTAMLEGCGNVHQPSRP